MPLVCRSVEVSRNQQTAKIILKKHLRFLTKSDRLFAMKKSYSFIKAAAIFLATSVLFSCQSTNQTSPEKESSEEAEISTPSGGTVTKTSIKKILQDIKITVSSSPKETVKGKAFASAYTGRVTNAAGAPYSDLAVTVEYPSARDAESISYSKASVTTAADGTFSWSADVPSFAADASVSFYPEVASSDPEIVALCSKAAEEAPWKVRNNLANHTGILVSVVDYRENGKIAIGNGSQPSTQAVTNFLWKNRLMGAQNADFHNSVDADDPARIRSDAIRLLQGNSLFRFVVYGRVRYASKVTQDADGYYNLTLSGDYGALDLNSGKVLFKTAKSVSVKEKNQWQLLNSAQQELARLFVQELLYSLYL